MQPFAFSLAGQGTDTLELDVYQPIGESFWYDSVSANAVRRQLKDNAKAKTIKLRVNSDGGDVFEAQSIYADLQAHAARKEGFVTGMAASAATLLLMACDQVTIAEGAWFMIHNAWGGASGSADDLETWAGVLRSASANIAKAYTARTGLSVEAITEMMANETWMTAAEAKAKGFVDVVVPMNAKAKASASGRASASLRSVAFAVASGDYTNVPESLRAQLNASAGRKPTQSDPQEEPEPMTIPKSITEALNLIEGADERSILAAITSLRAPGVFANAVHGMIGKSGDEALTALGSLKSSDAFAKKVEATVGKTGDEAIGTLQAWKSSHEKLPALEQQIADGKVSGEKNDLVALLKKGTDEKKLTKAESDKLKARVEAGFAARAEKRELKSEEWSVAQAQAFVEALPVQPNFQAPLTPRGDDATATNGASAVAHNGKAYEAMTPKERADLRGTEGGEAIYASLREDWERRGKPRAASKTAA